MHVESFVYVDLSARGMYRWTASESGRRAAFLRFVASELSLRSDLRCYSLGRGLILDLRHLSQSCKWLRSDGRGRRLDATPSLSEICPQTSPMLDSPFFQMRPYSPFFQVLKACPLLQSSPAVGVAQASKANEHRVLCQQRPWIPAARISNSMCPNTRATRPSQGPRITKIIYLGIIHYRQQQCLRRSTAASTNDAGQAP